jgi:hypothetical protein
MPRFRVIDPHGRVVGMRNFDSAEAAYPWFIDSIAGSSELGWRMEVDDEGQWALFDDTEGFTAPSSRRPPPNRLVAPADK